MIERLRLTLAWMMLLPAGMAWPESPPPPAIDARMPPCFDAESSQVKRERGTGLPVHRALADYVRDSLRRGATPAAECQGVEFGYRTRVTPEGIEIESRYLRNGRQHARAVFDEQGLHGATRILWPDGRLQAVEFHCSGVPVGFHRYHDERGRLIALADFSASDYRTERNRKGGRRYVSEGGSVLSLPQRSAQANGRVLVRKLYAVRNGRVTSTHLQWPGWRGGYDTLGPASSLDQWLQPGPQGWATVDGMRVMPINDPLDYRPFAQVYARHRLGLPGADPLEAPEQAVLRCPWIDEAMKPPVADPALALPAVAPVPDAERAATPRARYVACMLEPTSQCLLQWGVYQVDAADSQRERAALAAAAAAEALQDPAALRRAADLRFARMPELHQTDPALALPELLRARAAQLEGDHAEASRLARAAVARMQGPRLTHERDRWRRARRTLGPLLAEWGFLQDALSLYALQEQDGDPHAWRTLQAVGLAQARAGRQQEALASAERIRMLAPPPPLAGKDLDVPGPSWLTPRSSLATALGRMAQAAALHGRGEAAQRWIAQAQAQLAEAGDGVSAEARLHVALAHARLGHGESVAQWLASTANRGGADERLRVIGALCESGARPAGLALLLQEPQPRSSDATWRSAAAHAACGNHDAASTLFETARQQSEATPPCRSDVCGPFGWEAANRLAVALIDARRFELLQDWAAPRPLQPVTRLRWAAALADAGDAAGAARLATVELAPQEDTRWTTVRVLQQLVHARIAKARASPVAAALDAAASAAEGLDGSHGRMLALLEVAGTARDVGDPGRARIALGRALAHADALLESGTWPGAYVREAQQAFGRIAEQWVLLGDDAEAERAAAASVLQPGTAQLRRRQAAAANEIRAVAAFHAGRHDQALALAEDLPPSDARVLLLDLVWRRGIAPGPPASGWMERRWQELPDAVRSAESAHAARRLIGVHANWLRETGANAASAQRFDALASAAQALAPPDMQARSLCELAATAHILGLDRAPALWSKARLLLQERVSHFRLPPATGACAYWLRRGGDPDAAKALVDESTKPLREAAARKQGLGRWANTDDLLLTSIALAEATHGEIARNWREGWWR